MKKLIEKIKNYFNAKDFDKYDDLPVDEQYYRLRIEGIKNGERNSRAALFFIAIIAIVFIIALIVAGVSGGFNTEVTASAEEENVVGTPTSSNSVPLAPGAVLIYENYEDELLPLWSYSGDDSPVDLSSLSLTSGVYQVVCIAFNSNSESFFLTNLVYVDSEFPNQVFSVNDYGANDSFIDLWLSLEDSTLEHGDFFNSFREDEGAYVTFYALYKVESEPSSSGVNIDQINDIMFDGVSFSANAIATSISYTFENLFLNEDGSLTVYTQLVLWFAGISLLLSFVRMLTDWLFSLGGNKDKL